MGELTEKAESGLLNRVQFILVAAAQKETDTEPSRIGQIPCFKAFSEDLLKKGVIRLSPLSAEELCATSGF